MTGKRRIHITGASGAGVSTLGRALASRLEIPHHDTDDYYWLPSDPPFRDKRKIAERLALMEQMFLGRPAWVLSGALESWGSPIVPYFSHVVFVTTETDVRLRRLRAREKTRIESEGYGADGSRSPWNAAFLDWASRYDQGDSLGRSLTRHETWVATLTCNVIRVDGAESTPELVDEILASITESEAPEQQHTGT